MEKKIKGLLGIAKRAGALKSGEFSLEKSVKVGIAELVIAADDLSEASKKRYVNMCEYYKVPVLFYSDKESLGAAIGVEFAGAIAVLDKGFSDKMSEYILAR